MICNLISPIKTQHFLTRLRPIKVFWFENIFVYILRANCLPNTAFLIFISEFFAYLFSHGCCTLQQCCSSAASLKLMITPFTSLYNNTLFIKTVCLFKLATWRIRAPIIFAAYQFEPLAVRSNVHIVCHTLTFTPEAWQCQADTNKQLCRLFSWTHTFHHLQKPRTSTFVNIIYLFSSIFNQIWSS